MQDIAISYNKYQFIGFEFLTWLWFVVENKKDIFKQIYNSAVSIEIGNRIVLQNNSNNYSESIIIKGDQAGLEEGILSLKKGALVTEMNIIFKKDNMEWKFSIKGESLSLTGLKIPETGPMETKEDLYGVVLEKIYLYDQIIELVDRLYSYFIKKRLTDDWKLKIISEMQHWITK